LTLLSHVGYLADRQPQNATTGELVNALTMTPAELFWFGIALVISLPLGGIATAIFYRRLIKRLDLASKLPAGPVVPGWLIGVIERIFFTIVVAYDISGAAVGMVAWITVKMVSSWNRPDRTHAKEDAESAVQLSMAALLASLVSVTFAAVGGLLWRAALLS